MLLSTHSGPSNQQRTYRSQVSGANIPTAVFTHGNETERVAAQAIADAAIATEVAALVSGGHVRAKQLLSQYSLEELRAAYQRSIA
jgi:hypothetical protein